jgi:hypothetical protein
LTPAEAKACAAFLGGSYRHFVGCANVDVLGADNNSSIVANNDLFMALLLRAREKGEKWLLLEVMSFICGGADPIGAMVSAVVKYMEGKNV